MDEKEILSVSLASLMKIHPPQPNDLYYEGCILGRRELLNEDTPLELFRFPTRINAFGVVFCSKGSVTTIANLKHFVIGPRSMFVCPPGTIIQVESEEDAAVHFILCEEEFIQRMNIDLKHFLYLFMAVRENPCLSLDEEEWEEVNYSLEELFKEGRSHRKDPISIEIMRQLFRTASYRFCRIIDRRLAHQAEKAAVRDRKNDYFNRFLEELSKHYMQERSVGFYAEQLHLTPKYLTTILRTTTGRTATEWIDEYVVLEAKNLLKYSTMNIQEIAYYLNFPNQSFFGKYFKQHTGMTPSAYRPSK